MQDPYFEYIHELPSTKLRNRSEDLIGFQETYQKISKNLNLILNHQDIKTWSKKYHKKELPLCSVIGDRHPLVIFEGDVGTGKTVTAEGIADQITRDMEKDGYLLKLSTRVRGKGLHGEMSKLIQEGFDRLLEEAGKKRLAFLLIDEADSIASTRVLEQMHQEEKAAINTLIQKLDDIRAINGRAVVFLCTNRAKILDQAIVRRASLQISFYRPDDHQRSELFAKDLEGLGATESEIKDLVNLTSSQVNGGVGYTYSDIRFRLFPEAIAQVFPDKPLTVSILKKVAKGLKPSPEIQ